MKCTLCEGSGKFEEYTCYKCGGCGEYLWTEELFKPESWKKFEFIVGKIDSEYLKIARFFDCNMKNLKWGTIVLIKDGIYKNVLFKFKNKKEIFDFNFVELWIQLHPSDGRFFLEHNCYEDEK